MAEIKNKKWETLLQEYLIDLNQTQAAIRAGYSPKSANQQASEIMAKPNVRARLAELMAERSRRTGVNQDRVVRELARVAFVDPTKLIDFKTGALKPDANEDDRAAIAGVRVKIIPTAEGEGVERETKVADKLKALELLGKHMGMFTDNLNLSVEVPKIIDDIGKKEPDDRGDAGDE